MGAAPRPSLRAAAINARGFRTARMVRVLAPLPATLRSTLRVSTPLHRPLHRPHPHGDPSTEGEQHLLITRLAAPRCATSNMTHGDHRRRFRQIRARTRDPMPGSSRKRQSQFGEQRQRLRGPRPPSRPSGCGTSSPNMSGATRSVPPATSLWHRGGASPWESVSPQTLAPTLAHPLSFLPPSHPLSSSHPPPSPCILTAGPRRPAAVSGRSGHCGRGGPRDDERGDAGAPRRVVRQRRGERRLSLSLAVFVASRSAPRQSVRWRREEPRRPKPETPFGGGVSGSTSINLCEGCRALTLIIEAHSLIGEAPFHKACSSS